MDALRFKGARHAARIDQQVGERMRKRRTLLGLTQEQLADSLDISYQQIQKYETGANRVSAGRLYQIAQKLEVPIGHFFEGLGIDFEGEDGLSGVGANNRPTLELIRNFNLINDPAVRNSLSQLVKSMASISEGAARDAAQAERDEANLYVQDLELPHRGAQGGAAHGQNAHPQNLHSGNGHSANGHSGNGRSANGHGSNGHGSNGHGSNGHGGPEGDGQAS